MKKLISYLLAGAVGALAPLGASHAGYEYKKIARTLRVAAVGELAQGVLSAPAGSDFGALAVGSSAQRSFVFRNTGVSAAEGVQVVLPVASGLSLTANTCGTASAPSRIEAQGSCTFTLQWQPTKASALTGSVIAVTGLFRGQAQMPLSGVAGGFDATAVWSASAFSQVALTSSHTDAGALTQGSSKELTVYVRNTGSRGAPVLGMSLDGNTDKFEIAQVQAYYFAQLSSQSTCAMTNAALVPLCASPYDAANGGATGFSVKVRYTARELGTHSTTLRLSTGNGTQIAQDALTLSGTSKFNPTLAASSSSSSTVAFTSSSASFGTRTVGLSVDKTIYFRSVGTHGRPSLGLTMQGDTGQFTIVDARAYYSAQGSASSVCSVLNGREVAPCLSPYDPANGGSTGYSVTVRYTPTAVGDHSVSFAYSSANGTVLPEGPVLTARGEFNPAVAASSSSSSTTALTAANLNFGTVASGAYVDKTFYLRSVGTHGKPSVGVTLSGADADKFRIQSFTAHYSAQGTASSSCPVASANEAAPCLLPWEPSSGGSLSYSVTLRYLASTAGTPSVSVGFTTANGTILPAAFTMTATTN